MPIKTIRYDRIPIIRAMQNVGFPSILDKVVFFIVPLSNGSNINVSAPIEKSFFFSSIEKKLLEAAIIIFDFFN